MSAPRFTRSQRHAPTANIVLGAVFIGAALFGIPLLGLVAGGFDPQVGLILLGISFGAVAVAAMLVGIVVVVTERAARRREERVQAQRPGAFVFSTDGLNGAEAVSPPRPGDRWARLRAMPISLSASGLEFWWMIRRREDITAFTWAEVQAVHPGTSEFFNGRTTSSRYAIVVHLVDGRTFPIALRRPGLQFVWNLDPAYANSVLDEFRRFTRIE